MGLIFQNKYDTLYLYKIYIKKRKGARKFSAYKVIKMKRLFALILVMTMIVSFSACVTPEPTVHKVSGKTVTMDGTITGYYETEYTQIPGRDSVESIVSFKYTDAEQNVLIDLVSDDKMSITSAFLAEEVVGNESVYYRLTDMPSQSSEKYIVEEYFFNDGTLTYYMKRNNMGYNECKYFQDGKVIIHEILDVNQGIYTYPSHIGNEIIIYVSNAGGDKDQYTKTYNATTGDVISTEYELYDENGLCLGSYTYDSEGNKIDEKFTHYIKEYKNNGEATVTLYDYAGTELGTAKYSGGYCQAGK